MSLPFINADRRQWCNQRAAYAMYNHVETSCTGSLSNGFGNLSRIGYVAWNYQTIGAGSSYLIGDHFESSAITGSQCQSRTWPGQG
jgi:hypothetical protein